MNKRRYLLTISNFIIFTFTIITTAFADNFTLPFKGSYPVTQKITLTKGNFNWEY